MRGAVIAAAIIAAAGACKSRDSQPTPAGEVTPPTRADAAPKTETATPAKRPTKLEPPTEPFKKALREGRALIKARQYAAAVVKLDEALAAAPGHARVLSELSVAALRAGDTKRAIEAARRSIETAIDKRLEAASLYNLGVALEKDGDPAGAIEALQKSLALRPHDGVAKRLADLGGSPAPAGSITISALKSVSGPEALCADDIEWKKECEVQRLSKAPAINAAPFSDALGYYFDKGPEPIGFGWQQNCHLAVKTGAGWFARATALPCDEQDVTDVAIGAHPIEGGGHLLSFRSGTFRDGRHSALYQTWIQVCGVGPSKTPSCTEAIEIAYELISYDEEGEETRETGETPHAVTRDGKLVIGARGERRSHELAFP